VVFVYISEAHAVDVWNIGMSAGTLNYSHKIIEDRRNCAVKMIDQYQFNVPTYLDNMNNDLQTGLSAWPVRYYVIKFSEETQQFVFVHIGVPSDAEMDFGEIFEIIGG